MYSDVTEGIYVLRVRSGIYIFLHLAGKLTTFNPYYEIHDDDGDKNCKVQALLTQITYDLKNTRGRRMVLRSDR